ncbi:hypothetical protein Asal01_02298 [Fodinibius salicampi]
MPLLMLWPVDARAQLIKLKTAPVATGDQFLVQPSVNVGMGGLSIALDDTLADSFVNPAKAGRLGGTRVYMNPAFYKVTDGNGAVKTLSVGGLTSGNHWFGGVGIAIQEMSRPHTSSNRLRDQSTNNNYFWMQAGRALNKSQTLGARLHWAGLGAMSGVDMLYPRSRRIDQDGYMMDLRLGLDGETGTGARYEALALFTRTDMTHEVIYSYSRNNGCMIEPWMCNSIMIPELQPSNVEENMDKTNTWGLHFGYDQPVQESNWNWGSILTLNYKTHPKIPNYELMNIPRDPGNTWSFNAGLGASNTSDDNVTFGIDFIIEPIWSNTWVEAQNDIWNQEETEVLVRKGEKTIENDFEFINSVIKTGVGWQGTHALLEAGILAKTYRYDLKQKDYVEDTYREQEESWTEWTFSLAAGAIFRDITIQYTTLITTGTGQPGTASTGGWTMNAANAFSMGGEFIFAPDGELALESAKVFTHQLTVTLPL